MHNRGTCCVAVLSSDDDPDNVAAKVIGIWGGIIAVLALVIAISVWCCCKKDGCCSTGGCCDCCNEAQHGHPVRNSSSSIASTSSTVSTPQPVPAVQQPAGTPMAVTVPPGHGPGMTIQVQSPSGQILQVVIPQGVAEGGQFIANVPSMVQPQVVQPVVAHSFVAMGVPMAA
jgi:hypothetical protein